VNAYLGSKKIMKQYRIVIASVLLFTGLIGVRPLFAAQKELYITPKFGLSEFTGIAGLEMQYRHLALDIGYPLSGGVRYYFHPVGHSWFLGLFGHGYGFDHDETKDGIAYTHFSTIAGGAGGGYRWLWRSRWKLELGMTVGYAEKHWTNEFVIAPAIPARTDHAIQLGPIAAVGISF
jgi:hypothetical protein